MERGHSPRHDRLLRDALGRAEDKDDFEALLRPAVDHPTGPDTDAEDKLRAIDWERENIVAFVGRIIPAKGVQALVAAFPLILTRHPGTRLLVVGTGWLRQYLHAFALALSRGEGQRATRIMAWAAQRDPEGARPSGTAFLQRLDQDRRIDAYFDAAQRLLRPDRLVFTGFLEHHLLAHVFPLADVAVFPSAVAEASPLVIPEAAACGCLPLGTDFAGMKHSLDRLDPHLPESLRPLTRLRPDPELTADDIAHNVSAALDARADARADVRDALRRAAVQEYDWRRIARTLAEQLRTLATPR